MRLYLVRHGHAVRGGSHADADRPLTSEGVSAVRGTGRGLQRLGVQPRALLSSPARRCHETAELLAEVLGAPVGAVRVVEALSSGSSPARILPELSGWNPLDELLLVGHDPGLAAIGSMLLGSPAQLAMRLQPGGCACLQVESSLQRGRAALLWLMTPEQLGLL